MWFLLRTSSPLGSTRQETQQTGREKVQKVSAFSQKLQRYVTGLKRSLKKDKFFTGLLLSSGFTWNVEDDFKTVPKTWIPAHRVKHDNGHPLPDEHGHIPGGDADVIPVEMIVDVI